MGTKRHNPSEEDKSLADFPTEFHFTDPQAHTRPLDLPSHNSSSDAVAAHNLSSETSELNLNLTEDTDMSKNNKTTTSDNGTATTDTAPMQNTTATEAPASTVTDCDTNPANCGLVRKAFTYAKENKGPVAIAIGILALFGGLALKKRHDRKTSTSAPASNQVVDVTPASK